VRVRGHALGSVGGVGVPQLWLVEGSTARPFDGGMDQYHEHVLSHLRALRAGAALQQAHAAAAAGAAGGGRKEAVAASGSTAGVGFGGTQAAVGGDGAADAEGGAAEWSARDSGRCYSGSPAGSGVLDSGGSQDGDGPDSSGSGTAAARPEVEVDSGGGN
jgi:hypothetical protein